MVGFEEIQTAYYLVVATGVLLAAFYYALNLRETMKNRRITLTTTLMQPFLSRAFPLNLSLLWGNLNIGSQPKKGSV